MKLFRRKKRAAEPPPEEPVLVCTVFFFRATFVPSLNTWTSASDRGSDHAASLRVPSPPLNRV